MRKRLVAMAVMALGALSGSAVASSHREAPFLTENPKVDGTDFYMFRSYQPGRDGFVTLIANYLPLQDPNGGPNYFQLDPDAVYELHVDNDADAKEDLTFQFRFKNPLNGDNGLALDIGSAGQKKSIAVPQVNIGQVTAEDSSKLNVQESYSVKVIRGDRRNGSARNITNVNGGDREFKKPLDNIGRKTFGNNGDPSAYETYARKHIYDVNIPGCSSGKMFVGQRKESFAVNLGPIFDLVNAPASVITDNSKRSLVSNPLDSKSITTIAMEVPISCLKSGSQNVIGGWTTASLRQARVLKTKATYDRPALEGGPYVQVSRLGHPLINEVIIGLKDKNRWNGSRPKDDAQFLDYVTHPTLPAIIEALFGPAVKAPTAFPRQDLVAVFLTGVPNVNLNGATAEYLRLNTALPATPKANQNNLGAAACFVNGALTLSNPGCDPAGFPNGRRPGDDVVDIELRAAMGYLLPNDTQAPSRNVPFHDAVLQDASMFDSSFPYLTMPLPGANGNGS